MRDRPASRFASETSDSTADDPPQRSPLVTDGGTDRSDASPADDEDADRRRLIMWVLVIAFAVPLIVEGLTLVGLVGSYFGPAGTAAPSATPTPVAGVAEGQELLPDTDRTERVSTVTLQSGGEGWTLTVTAQVDNTGDRPYELRLGAVTTDGGRRIEGSTSTGRITPGESATVTAQWGLPAGDRPRMLEVTAVEFDDGEQTLVDRDVRVGRVPVQG
jgi:hypothetical protein